ncbi:unnamed protein product, partial [Lepidochelys olivacea]
MGGASQSNYVDALDPERLRQCPYDKYHRIRACWFPYHLIKCRKMLCTYFCNVNTSVRFQVAVLLFQGLSGQGPVYLKYQVTDR